MQSDCVSLIIPTIFGKDADELRQAANEKSNSPKNVSKS